MSNVQQVTDPDLVTGVDDPNRRRLMLVLAIAGGVIIAGAAAYFLFLSGGGSDTEDFGPLPPQTGATAKPDKGDDESPETKPLPEEFDGVVGRDPFQPLAAEAVVPPVVEDVEVEATSEPIEAGTDATGGDDSADANTSQVKVKAVSVAKGQASVSVDGKQYTVKEGVVFPSATTGPFKAVVIGMTAAGRAFVKVEYGSDLPVVIKSGGSAHFGG